MNEFDLAKLWDIFCKSEESASKLRSLYLDIVFSKELRNVEKKKISDIFKTAEGGTPSRFKKEYWGGDIPWLVSGELKDRVIHSSREKITQEGFNSSSTKLFPKDTSLIAITGATVGVTGLLAAEFCANQSIVGIYPHKDYYPKFVWYFLMSKYNYFRNLTSGSAQPHINKRKIDNSDFPLVSREVQARIIKKIEDFFQLLERYRPLINDVNKSHERLLEACFNNLMSPDSNETILKSWNLVDTHFEELISELTDVKKIEETILHLAISGKLVPQDPNDQPASELLEKIKTEKGRLIREGKIKKEAVPVPITKDEIPFELPQNWMWVRLSQICKLVTDGDHKTPPRISKGKRLLSAKNVRDGYLEYENCDFISLEDYNKSRQRCLPEIGDLLIVSVGGTIGRTSLILKDSDFALVRSVALVKPLMVNSFYVRYVLNSKFLQDLIDNKKRGGAQPCLYIGPISNLIFPLPPLFEQLRIVQKVDQLMKLCNELEETVKENQNNSELLMEVVMKEAFAS